MFRAQRCKECFQKRTGLVPPVYEASLPDRLTQILLDVLSQRARKLQLAEIGFGRAAAAAAAVVHVPEIKREITARKTTTS